MPTFTLTDLPRELTDDESAQLTALCSEVIRGWELDRLQPSHICRKKHAGKVIEKPLMIGDEPVTGKAMQLTERVHEFEPRCHDCGRLMHRPAGFDDTTWHCPNARRPLPAGGPDTAVECGEKR